MTKLKVVVFLPVAISLLTGRFPVGEFYLREVLSHSSARSPLYYRQFSKFLDIFIKRGLRGIGP